MTDIVERIRSLRYVHVPAASGLMAEACQEIERLRLTDQEREALQRAVAEFSSLADEHESSADCCTADTLRSLLERLA